MEPMGSPREKQPPGDAVPADRDHAVSLQVGEFLLLRRLGSGAFGEVWLARRAAGAADGGEAPVALKVLRDSVARDPEARKRFERESRAALSLRHPHVVAALGGGLHGGRPYLVSEYVAGGSLQERLDRAGPLDDDGTVMLAADLLAGLAAVHDAGLVHRDLKPANVLLDSGGRAKIADLGLARPVSAQRTMLTAADEVVGTPAYMAPEQITDGCEVDIRADLYALGVMLFRARSGQLPFDAADVLSLLRQKTTGSAKSLRACQGVARPLADFVGRLLARRREDRPSNPAEALAELRAAASLALRPGLGQDASPRSVPLEALPGTLPDGPGPRGGGSSPVDAAHAATLPLDEVRLLPGGAEVQCLRGPDGELLTVFTAEELVLGRDAADADPGRLCLRLLPSGPRAQDSLRISSSHLALRRTDRGWSVRDLGSSHGTTLDGRRLEPGIETSMLHGARIVLAGVLELRVECLPRPEASGPGPRRPSPPSLLLTRPDNGAHQRYLLLASPVALDFRARPVALGRGTAILSASGGALQWLAAPPPGVGWTSRRPQDPKS